MEQRKVKLTLNDQISECSVAENTTIAELKRIAEERYLHQSRCDNQTLTLLHMGEILTNEVSLAELAKKTNNSEITIEIKRMPRETQERDNQASTDTKTAIINTPPIKKLNMADSSPLSNQAKEEPLANLDTAKENQNHASIRSEVNSSPNETQEASDRSVWVKDGTGKLYAVPRSSLVSFNGKLYMLRKRQRTSQRLQQLMSQLPQLSTILTYLVVTTLFTIYMNKIFFAILLGLLALCSLEKIRLKMEFKRSEPIKNIGKHIISFFVSILLNPGYNLTVYSTS
ncbi:hypothetical protein NEHOM01_1101 [Nematocida homosporus]|uniref:uncharacterized protein n=1 Tax=Nematocida homosporus TaxID=1912981 RepID=UPI00221E592E|nr:uncharacterized protein NEHOM01_1101 [Nematocida homosporus]KAI5185824.1 hypothetical protein NEHOM01_1101 [Nematocida homosporus]